MALLHSKVPFPICVSDVALLASEEADDLLENGRQDTPFVTPSRHAVVSGAMQVLTKLSHPSGKFDRRSDREGG